MSAAAWRAAAARSPSALVTTTRSASSMIPRLMPCRSSPPAGEASSTNRSTRSATASSDWPTPTVSTSTTSKPAASHSSIASRVRRATPPSSPPAGDGRMKAFGSRASVSMRVLSPEDRAAAAACSTDRRPAPPPRGRRPIRWVPNASMKVDLPTPGGPLMPMRTAPPVRVEQRSTQRDGLLAVVGAGGLDQRDGAGQRPPVARRMRARGLIGLGSRSSRGRRWPG